MQSRFGSEKVGFLAVGVHEFCLICLIFLQVKWLELQVTKFKHLTRRARTSRNGELAKMKLELRQYLPGNDCEESRLNLTGSATALKA